MRAAGVRAALLAICIAAIGAIDYISGPEIGFSLFYLVPIAWAGWTIDSRTTAGLAVLAALFWLAADIAWVGLGPISLWNGFTRLGIYVAMGLLVARVRLDRQQMQALNDRLARLLEQEQQLARTDALTGLANRRLFVDELRRSAAHARRARVPVAVAFLDLTNFKRVNDRLGHAAGDAVLVRAAGILKDHIRGSDLVARFGGDEFAVLLRDGAEEPARITMTRVLERLQQEFADVSGIALGVSVGVASFDVPPDEPQTVLDHADAAMYSAKARGSREVYVVRFPAAAGG